MPDMRPSNAFTQIHPSPCQSPIGAWARQPGLCPDSNEDKNRHAEWCPHHLGGGEGATIDVITPPAVTAEDGMAAIRGGFAGTWSEPKTGATRPGEPDGRKPDDISPRAGLAVLLWALWAQAELSTWKPFDPKRRGQRHGGHGVLSPF